MTNETLPPQTEADAPPAAGKKPGKATGPRTAAGKAVSRQNASTHRLTGTPLVCSTEERATIAAYQADLAKLLKPVGTIEEALVATIAFNTWQSMRVPVILQNLIATGTYDGHYETGDERSTDALNQARSMVDIHRAMANVTLCDQRLRKSIRDDEQRLAQYQRARRNVGTLMSKPIKVAEAEMQVVTDRINEERRLARKAENDKAEKLRLEKRMYELGIQDSQLPYWTELDLIRKGFVFQEDIDSWVKGSVIIKRLPANRYPPLRDGE